MKKYDKKLKIYLAVLLFFIIAISASAVSFLDSSYFAYIAKTYISSYLSKKLKKTVTLKRIKFSVFSPQISIYGLKVKNFAKIKQIDINIGHINIFRRELNIYKINIINPDLNVLIKNNKFYNYKKIASVIKEFSVRRPNGLISLSFDKIKISGGSFNFNDIDKNILINLKKINLTVYKKPSKTPFIYKNAGIYFKYDIPYIFLKSGKLKYGGVYSSSAEELHYIKGFVYYRKVRFGNKYFNVSSGGILELKKKILFPEIIKKINDTTVLKVNDLSFFSKRFNELPALKGKLRADVSVVGAVYGRLKSKAVISLKDTVFSGGDFKSGKIICTYERNGAKDKNNTIKFKRINLKVFNGTFSSKGSINLNEKEGRFKSVLKKIDVGKLIEFYDTEKIPQLKGGADGSITTFLNFGKHFYAANIAKINLSKPVEQLKFKNKKGVNKIYRISYGNLISLNGAVLVNDKYVIIKNTGILSRNIRGVFGGKINYVKKYLNFNFQASYNRLPKIDLVDEYKSRYFNPSADGTLTGNIAGKFKGIYFNFKNRFNRLFINEYTAPFRGRADFNITGSGRVIIKKVRLKETGTDGAGKFNFNGEIYKDKISDKELINGYFNAKNLAASHAGFIAVFNSGGNIKGELKNPLLTAFGNSKKAVIYGQDVGEVNFKFSVTKKILNLYELKGLYGGAYFNAYGSLNFKGTAENGANGHNGGGRDNYNINIVSNGINFSNLNFNFFKKYSVKGIADADLHIGGTFNLPDISGSVYAEKVSVKNYRLGGIKAVVNSSKRKMKLHLYAMDNAIDAKAKILLEKGYPYNFITNIKLLSVNYRKTLFRLSGGIFGSGKLSNFKNSYLFSKLDYVYLKHGPFFLQNTKNIKISYIDRTVEFSGFKLKGGNNYFQLRGYITPRKYHIILNDRTDLWVIGIFTNKIINSSGFATASAVIFGPFASPEIYGFANIKRGLVEPSVYSSFTASRIFAKVTFNKNMIYIKKARFRMLNGIFSARGIIRLRNFLPSYYRLETNFNSAVYRASDYFYAEMSGQLGFSGRPDNPVLYGRIKIKKALYDKKINFSSFLLSYKKYSAVTQSPPVSLINPRLNVKVVSKKKIEIKNNIINTNFSADLNILGTLDNPVIIGTANAEKGDIFFRGTELKLSYANLDFNNRYKINPTFDVAARTYINQYMIRMNASGSMLNFNVNLSSTPPLSELSIVSMLALGTTANSVYASSAGGIAASEAASAIGGGVEQSVTGTISSYFGFKNMSVTPGYSAITHSAAPQVTVSKNLTKRLSVSYSDIASSQSSQSATITYTLTPHISVIGVWENNELAPNNSNVYSEVGGNIVFHFRFY
jgi:hypothetical protein